MVHNKLVPAIKRMASKLPPRRSLRSLRQPIGNSIVLKGTYEIFANCLSASLDYPIYG